MCFWKSVCPEETRLLDWIRAQIVNRGENRDEGKSCGGARRAEIRNGALLHHPRRRIVCLSLWRHESHTHMRLGCAISRVPGASGAGHALCRPLPRHHRFPLRKLASFITLACTLLSLVFQSPARIVRRLPLDMRNDVCAGWSCICVPDA